MEILIRNHRGISLVEVLVTLAILSLVGIIIWGVFFQGFSFSKKMESKNALQQEANLIITNLTKVHQTSTEYQISNTTDTENHKNIDCKMISVTYKTDNSGPTNTLPSFDRVGMCYSADVTRVIYPMGSDNFLKITIKIEDENDRNNFVQMDAYLSRLK
jgi:type II secretory pathway component PulJ